MRTSVRVIACALIAVAALSCHVRRGPRSAEKAKQELLSLENRWLQVENDPVALEDILAPDFLHVVPVGMITKEQHIRFLREHPGPEQHTHKRFENLNVRIYGDTGIVNGAVVETTDRGEHKTLFTDVFAYRDGKWQAVSAQELAAATR